tara:strand:- start:564 stop:1553 length:990 start_codon:yes stop_codon:yes gene_type:complete
MTETASLEQRICRGDRRALAKGITLIESTRADHREDAVALLEALMPSTGEAVRIGISGAPGVGKSTFIEALGNHLIDLGHRVAVLAVDPTSAVTGGSILGDKTRMQTLAFRDQAFVRPSPAAGTLGGVTRRTRESMLLCEAAGFDVIIVETVGVGQSETAVADMTDAFLLLLLPAGGDELQGIKRGIMELADIILVNKADGEQRNAAERTMADYRAAQQFIKPRYRAWQPSVATCSALDGLGIETVWQQLLEMRRGLIESGEFDTHRAEQARAWMWAETTALLIADLTAHPAVRALVADLEQSVRIGETPATVGAQRLIAAFKAASSDA